MVEQTASRSLRDHSGNSQRQYAQNSDNGYGLQKNTSTVTTEKRFYEDGDRSLEHRRSGSFKRFEVEDDDDRRDHHGYQMTTKVTTERRYVAGKAKKHGNEVSQSIKKSTDLHGTAQEAFGNQKVTTVTESRKYSDADQSHVQRMARKANVDAQALGRGKADSGYQKTTTVTTTETRSYADKAQDILNRSAASSNKKATQAAEKKRKSV